MENEMPNITGNPHGPAGMDCPGGAFRFFAYFCLLIVLADYAYKETIGGANTLPPNLNQTHLYYGRGREDLLFSVRLEADFRPSV